MTPAANHNSQLTLSSYFSQQKTPAKRDASLIDLTMDDDDEAGSPAPPTKKNRPSVGDELEVQRAPATPTAVSKFFTPKKKPEKAFQSRPLPQSPVAKYAHSTKPHQNDLDEDMLTPRQQQARDNTREAFRKKLGGRFERRDTDSLQIAEDDPQYDLAAERSEKEDEPSAEPEPEATQVDVAASDMSSKLKVFAAASSKRSTKSSSKPDKPAAKGRSKKVKEIGPSGEEYTPLENQIRASKAEHPDCLLLFEVGYKYRFFGNDAQIASKELGIACWLDRNFLTASIPVHRKTIHVKKLISQGHKVGIIGQTETAALKKVGDNKSGPFRRGLTELYTAATFVGELDSTDDISDESPTAPPSLACFVETLMGGMGADQLVSIGMVSVIPSTGEVTYDEWQDSHMRTELETRITHIRPSELLIPDGNALSKSTLKMLEYFTGNKRFNSGRNIRIERFQEQMKYDDAFAFVSEFYAKRSKGGAKGDVMATVVNLPQKVIIALAHTIDYLTNFRVADVFLEATFFATFASRTHMLLNGTTMTNLEIYRNSTDFAEKGSLLWILNHTKTRFGGRMLKSWIGRPLVDKSVLQERVDAIEEILADPPSEYDKLVRLLKGLPDLVKGLARITYGKCSPKELAALLSAYQRVADTFEPVEDPTQLGFKSSLWVEIVSSMPLLRKPLAELASLFDLSKARFDGDKADLWLDDDKYPDIIDCKCMIATVEGELGEELKQVRKILKRPTLNWTSVLKDEYLIEVRHAEAKKVPPEWSRVSSTKAVIRFQTPTVKRKIAERDQHKEALAQVAEEAWQDFLEECRKHYAVFRDVTNKLATADCLQSLAVVANQSGYCRPEIVDEDRLSIVNGRHPMAEAMRSDPFVPNTIMMGGNDTRTKIITGPNMNGKSTCCRMVALITIMAQIGSYVPADQVTLSLHDCVLTRMGATDDLARGQSTFMVELQETSDIMRQATSRSLIILDELGRGTSTHDGQAIAAAVLHHLQTVKRPKTLFITHYPLLAADFAEEFEDVANLHMAHRSGERRSDGSRPVEFLYRLAPGMASGSYGIECGRLAGLSDSVIAKAQSKSNLMKSNIETSTGSRKWRTLLEASLDAGRTTADRSTAAKRLRRTLLL